MTTFRLRGISVSGRHGASPGEQDEVQEFVIDVDVDVHPGSDDLGSTADYRDVVRAARRVVEEESFELLESIADAVARDVKAIDGVHTVRAVVHKPSAALRLGIDDVAAEATLE